MLRFFGLLYLWFISLASMIGQNEPTDLTPVKNIEHLSIKNQGMSGTCWNFSMTSEIETEVLRKGMGHIDLSEMFIVRNIYSDKARNYLYRQGNAQFSEGGLGHDVINGIRDYGIVPLSAYNGVKSSENGYNHTGLSDKLKNYLNLLLKNGKIKEDWERGVDSILDEYFPPLPVTFEFQSQKWTPQHFAAEVLKFRKDDYVGLTSFLHRPFYRNWVVEVPDNWSNGAYLNVPLDTMINIVKKSISAGYSVLWDADVSNIGFNQSKGYALFLNDAKETPASFNAETKEANYDSRLRLKLYQSLETQDDHLMHIVGIYKNKEGKTFFKVKNSWGTTAGPFGGYIYVSEAYFAINTITVIVPAQAVSSNIRNLSQSVN